MQHYKQSLYSVYSGEDSMEGTPETKSIPFSSEDTRCESLTMAKSTAALMDNVHDPFVGTSTKPKSEAKLSATASSFEPFGLGLGFGSLASTKLMTSMALKSAAPLPGTAQHLEYIIAAEENSPLRRAPPAPQATKVGFFTTEVLASRHVKITGIFLDDIRDRVQESINVRLMVLFIPCPYLFDSHLRSLTYILQKFNNSDYQSKSISRLEQVKNIVYLSFADIRDAIAFYNAIAKHHDNMAVEYIQGNNLDEVSSTNTNFIHSIHC
jgi:hypothetical protein